MTKDDYVGAFPNPGKACGIHATNRTNEILNEAVNEDRGGNADQLCLDS